ncbi:DUF2231 domain-containing protein [uncultured Sphingomonas sp.]|uniref:DUF2231 domain-containing protein n=1 Tax=uncultured Sphingomonas sp. TaxID=158754 RepID=UPI0025EC7481|nr:DUF2231 domain-containing protein [uncultured Sphingomonas sp.]
MPDPVPLRSRAYGLPLHPIVLGLPFICFLAALVADIAYFRTYDIAWKNFADWLLAGGMVLGALGAIVGVVDLVRPAVRANRLLYPYAIAYGVAMVLALLNNFIHSRDAYGAMPAGLVLSVLTVLVLTAASALGAILLRQSRFGGFR